MAIKLINIEWTPGTALFRNTYVMDSAEDAQNLPDAPTGSTAIVAEQNGPIYIVNASGEWKEL